MLQFNDITVHVARPVTSEEVARPLEIEPFELLADLISLEIFVAPSELISDAELRRLGSRIGVDFRIDEDGGAAASRTQPTGPHPTPSFEHSQGQGGDS